MVKAAYSSGKPAIGVGAGNTPAIIDDSADILLAVNSIIHSKTFDNGMICASEQSVIVLESIYDAVKAEFAARGCYFLDADETEKVRKTIIINGALNAKIVGQRAAKIAELAGVSVPSGTKILIGEVESVELSEEFAHEKLSPVLAMYRAKSFEDALDKADRLVADGGFGHTSSIYINEMTQREKLDVFGHTAGDGIHLNQFFPTLVGEEFMVVAKRNLFQPNLCGPSAVERTVIGQGLGFHHRNQ
jgi:acetaldehyde dehydrogenase/alcohol dehydrogenase